jgi:signal transduction histidine kinase
MVPIFEREALLERTAPRERALLASGERLLTRIGFDLHDGLIQDLAVIAGNVPHAPTAPRGHTRADPEADRVRIPR